MPYSKKRKYNAFPSSYVAPVAQSSQYRGSKPSIKNGVNGCCVSHVERIGSVDMLDTSQLYRKSIIIQPGLSSFFPWLSAMATRYESYKFKKLRFFFKTKTNTTTTGDISLGVDYDDNDAPPSSIVQMENWGCSANGSPWQNIELNCRYMDLNKRKTYFCRAFDVPAKDSQLLYDTGVLYVMTEGSPGSRLNVGYLYAEYEIEFMTPILNSNYQNPQVIGGSILGVGGTPAIPLGIYGSLHANSMGISYEYDGVSANGILKIQAPGTYLVNLVYAGTTITAPVLLLEIFVTGTASTIATVSDLQSATNENVVFSIIQVEPSCKYIFTASAATVATGAICTVSTVPTLSLQ